MMNKCTLIVTSILSFGIVIMSSNIFADPSLDAAFDIAAPRIDHDPIRDQLKENESLIISATVNDDQGVDSVLLFYRSGNQTEYTRLTMNAMAPGSNIYGVEIGAAAIQFPKFDYYIEAKDKAGNAELRGVSFSPLRVSVRQAETPEMFTTPQESVLTKEPPPLEGIASKDQEPNPGSTLAETSKSNSWRYWLLGTLAASVATSIAYFETRDNGSGEPETGATGVSGTITVEAPPL